MSPSGNLISDKQVFLTSEAESKLVEILPQAQEKVRGGVLRLKVVPGGCHGFKYAFSIDTREDEDICVKNANSVLMVVDPQSLLMVSGATIHFEESMLGGSFIVKNNPNQGSGCGCGSSFGI